jgi:hypothetical protein
MLSVGTAAAAFVLFGAGAAVCFTRYRRSRKPLFGMLAAISAVLSLAALVYCALALILVDAAQR